MQPINKEFNKDYLTGRLDHNFFSTKEVTQYYQLADYDGLTTGHIMATLDSFAMASYPPAKMGNTQALTLLFYKKKMFTDYNDHLYESAMDNDSRRLEEYRDDLLAALKFEQLNGDVKKISFKRLIYDQSKIQLKKTDTILLR